MIPFDATVTKVLSEAVEFVRAKSPKDFKPELALVLGSGLSDLANNVHRMAAIPYRDIPGFVSTNISGHKGELLVGELNGKKVLVFSGRVHFYEGYSMAQSTFPIRLAARLGTEMIMLTSAVGAINKKFCAGDIVVVKDHINLMGINPLRGAHNSSFGERFPDMSECYTTSLQKLALAVAKKNKIRAHSGNYFAVSGPSYETPAEIRAFRKLGGDVVGMSMIPESIVARQMKLKVLGLCYISNMAAGVSKQTLNHKEVLEVGALAAKKLSVLIEEIIKEL